MTVKSYDVYKLSCPSRTLLAHVAGKWTILVVYLLAYGPQRFGQILERVEGISQKMLTQTLRSLERDGLIDREVNPTTVPITVTYSLTDMGMALTNSLKAMHEWAEGNIEQVEQAQEQYDTLHPTPRTN